MQLNILINDAIAFLLPPPPLQSSALYYGARENVVAVTVTSTQAPQIHFSDRHFTNLFTDLLTSKAKLICITIKIRDDNET